MFSISQLLNKNYIFGETYEFLYIFLNFDVFSKWCLLKKNFLKFLIFGKIYN